MSPPSTSTIMHSRPIRLACVLFTATVVSSAAYHRVSSATTDRTDGVLLQAALYGTTLDAIRQIILPARVPSPQSAVVVDLQYCVALPTGSGRVRALIVPDFPTGTALPQSLSRASCSPSLLAVAQGARTQLADADWIGVVDAEAAWSPWQASVTILEGSVVGKSEAATAVGTSVMAMLRGKDLFSPVNTSNARIALGDGSELRTRIAAAFHGDSLILTAYEIGNDSPTPLAPFGDRSATSLVPGNAAVSMSQILVNTILAAEDSQSFGTAPNELVLDQGQVETGSNTLVIRARATHRSTGRRFDGRLDLRGNDLTVNRVVVRSISQNCAELPPAQRPECIAGNITAVAVAAGASTRLTDDLRGRQPRGAESSNSFEVDGRHLILTYRLLRLSSAPGSTTAYSVADFRELQP